MLLTCLNKIVISVNTGALKYSFESVLLSLTGRSYSVWILGSIRVAIRTIWAILKYFLQQAVDKNDSDQNRPQLLFWWVVLAWLSRPNSLHRSAVYNLQSAMWFIKIWLTFISVIISVKSNVWLAGIANSTTLCYLKSVLCILHYSFLLYWDLSLGDLLDA